MHVIAKVVGMFLGAGLIVVGAVFIMTPHPTVLLTVFGIVVFLVGGELLYRCLKGM